MALRPGNPDRAWNDPPMLPLNSPADCASQAVGPGTSPATVPAKRTPLNKRVAFPMSGPTSPPTTGQNAAINVSPPMYLPFGPPPAASANLPPASSALNASQLSNYQQPPIPVLLPPLITPEQDQTLRLERLNSFMTKIREKLSGYDNFLETKIKEDIERRLQALEGMWTEKKLNLDVENRLCMLAEKLKEGQVEEAETSFLALIADYAGTCANWSIGLKHLISAVKSSEADT